jgi:DNA-binding transcriptional LysR family regulator
MQYEISQPDLAIVLALARGGTLANAGAQLGVDASTVFRTIQRLEKCIGQRLFDRSRSGYRPTDLASELGRHAERIETELAAARGVFASPGGKLAGTVRISAVDAVLTAFVVPAVEAVRAAHPELRLELLASNDLASLTHRDVDIVLRSTNRPPGHVVGKRLGTMHFAVFTGRTRSRRRASLADAAPQSLACLPWIAIDDAMPEHPGVAWRKRMLPKVQPVLQANSMQTVVQLIECGMGVGVVALFHARRHKDLVQLTPVLDNCQIDLWILTHPESRHLRRIAEVARYIEGHVAGAGGID